MSYPSGEPVDTRTTVKLVKGFTLVELLVVIGIIAVLVGILLPALSGARRASMQVKCAASLRQISTAILLYSQDNHGYLPAWRVGNAGMSVGGAGGKYNINGITYGAATIVDNVQTNEAAYWMDFIAQYVTAGKGGSGNTSKQQQFITGESVLWGCPAWTGYTETRTNVVASGGGVNLQRSGYSYNYMPKMDIGYPTQTANASYPNTPEKCDIRSSDDFKSGVWTSSDNITKAVWYKLASISRQGERALVGDSNDFELEARAWDGKPWNGFAVPPQKTFYYDVVYARYGGSTIVPATSFDYYRHGKYPAVADGGAHGYFASDGGKVNYNIGYFDGHVSGSVDRTEAYRGLRMKFPDATTK